MSIAEIRQEEGALTVRWADGLRDAFQYFWLRDNCRCAVCGDKSGGHRYLELNDIPTDIAPRSVGLNGADVEIVWAQDDHRTVLSGDWLRASSYADRARRRQRPQLWDASLNASPPTCSYPEVVSSPTQRLALLENLDRYGLCLLHDVPREADEIERLARLVGFIRETHYGRVFDLIATRDQRILAETSHAIRPHHDELFRDPTPGVLIMHCLVASEDGRGESILVDGFQAASTLADTDRAAFDLLSQVPVTHARRLSDGVDDVALRATWHTITLDDEEAVSAVRINERTMAPLVLPQDLVGPTYAALRKLLAIVYDQRVALRLRLEPGQAMLIDNHRVLHARESFRGARHIRQCHVDRDEVWSRLNVLRDRHHQTEAAG